MRSGSALCQKSRKNHRHMTDGGGVQRRRDRGEVRPDAKAIALGILANIQLLATYFTVIPA